MYEIWGRYNGEWEKIDESDNRNDADYLVGEYMMAFGSDWIIEWRK